MPRVSEFENLCVQNPAGKRLGRVSQVLFHPSEARAIGFEITPAAYGNVVARSPRYVIYGDLVFEGDVARCPKGKLPSSASTERTLGYTWEESVIWRGMPVRSTDGAELGFVRDVLVGKSSGAVKSLLVSGGAVSDAALGRAEIGSESVVGFDGEAVVVDAAYSDLEMSGGAAAKTAAVAANVKVRGERLADKAVEGSVAAAVAVHRSFTRGRARKLIDTMREKAADFMSDDEG